MFAGIAARIATYCFSSRLRGEEALSED